MVFDSIVVCCNILYCQLKICIKLNVLHYCQQKIYTYTLLIDFENKLRNTWTKLHTFFVDKTFDMQWCPSTIIELYIWSAMIVNRIKLYLRFRNTNPKKQKWELIAWWIEFYAVSAIFQPCNGRKMGVRKIIVKRVDTLSRYKSLDVYQIRAYNVIIKRLIVMSIVIRKSTHRVYYWVTVRSIKNVISFLRSVIFVLMETSKNNLRTK